MRIDVKKMLFIGSHVALNDFFERAQRIGWFQFAAVQEPKRHALPKGIEDLKLAIRELSHFEVSKNPVSVNFHETPALVDRILVLKREIANLHEEIRYVKGEIVKMHPLGDFEVDDLKRLEKETNRNYRFFFVKHGRYTKEQIPNDLIFINREYDFDYYMHISKENFVMSGFAEIPIHKSLGELQNELVRLKKVSHDSEAELKSLADYLECLEDYFMHEMNAINLNFSKGDVEYCLDDNIFAIDAWLPTNQVDQIERLIKDLPVLYKEIAPLKDEKIPTYLQNKGLVAAGQDLVEIYDTPSSSEADPSSWVVWFFALFFGMIIADAGYGCIFLAFTIYLWTKVPKMKSSLGKRMVKLMTLLSCATIIWGVLIASYFSIKLEPNSKLNRVSILHYLAVHKIDYHMKTKDKTYEEWVHDFPEIQNSMVPETILETKKTTKDGKIKYVIMDQLYDSLLMEIALLVGVIHLGLSFLRNLRNHWAGIGWIAALVGGYLFFSSVISATPLVNYMGWMSASMSKIVGEQLLYGGLGTALVLALIQEKWGGLATIFKVIEVFADTLSYLRLYALGLSSMVLASTFNEMGMSAGYVGGALIILFGHIINIGLGTAAAVIHGLRLNLLEWYHHSFSGGGKKFNPLRLIIRE